MPRLGDATLSLLQDDGSREQLCDWLALGQTAEVMRRLRRVMVESGDKGQPRHEDGGVMEAASQGPGPGEEEADSEDWRQVGEEVQAAIGALKLELSKRFTSVYEAFVFLDMDGDAEVSIPELRAMLRQLGVEIPNLDGVIRGLSLHGDEIEVRRFCEGLSWHDLEDDHESAIDVIRPRRERVVAKAMRLCNAIKRRQMGGTMMTLGSQSSAGEKKDSQPGSPTLSAASRSSGAGLNDALLLDPAMLPDQGGGDLPDVVREGVKEVPQPGGFAAGNAASGGGGGGTGTLPGGARLAGDERLVAAQKFQQIDWAWRRKRLGAGGGQRYGTLASSPARQSVVGSSEGVREEEDEEARRQRLWLLFEQYDADKSGMLDAAEICQLLSDLGMHYKEAMVREAIKRILPPGTLHDSLNMEEFVQWWGYVAYAHSLGIREGALMCASNSYMKDARQEDAVFISQELHDCVQRQIREKTELGVSQGRVGLGDDGEVRLMSLYRSSNKDPKTCSEFLEHAKRSRKRVPRK